MTLLKRKKDKKTKLETELVAKVEELLNRNNELETMLKPNIDKVLSKLQELDQHKTYVVVADGVEEAKNTVGMLNETIGRIRAGRGRGWPPWTLPPIIVINAPIEGLNKETLQGILERVSK